MKRSDTIKEARTFVYMLSIYRVAQKSKPQSFVHIFVKYWPIVKIFSMAHSVENL